MAVHSTKVMFRSIITDRLIDFIPVGMPNWYDGWTRMDTFFICFEIWTSGRHLLAAWQSVFNMDMFSHSFRFAQSYPSFGPRNPSTADGSCDQLDRIKQRELALENKRKQLCYGDKDETEHVEPGNVNRTNQVAAGTGEISNDEDEQASSTGSHSFDDAEDDPEEDGNDLLGGDVSELDEDLQPQDGFNPGGEIATVNTPAMLALEAATLASLSVDHTLDSTQNDWTDEFDLTGTT